MRATLALLMAVAVAVAVAAPAAALAQPAADAYDQGLAALRGGRPAAAIPYLEAASKAAPGNADIWVNLGNAYIDVGRLRPAKGALARAQALSPGNLDLQLAQARLAYAEKAYDRAAQRLAPVASVMPNYPEVQQLHERIQTAMAREAAANAKPRVWWADEGLSVGRLTRGLPNDYFASVTLGRLLPHDQYVSGTVARSRQFRQDDTYVEGQWGVVNRGYLAVGGAPNARLQPEWSIRGGLASPYKLIDGWSHRLSADVGWSRYRAGDVRSIVASYEVARPGRFGVTGRWINVWDERNQYQSGFGLRAVWAPTPATQLLAGYADAPESQEGRTLRVKATTVGVGWEVSRDLSLRLVGAHEQHRPFNRDEVSVGATERF